jgi:hypothetical protein
MLNEPAFRDNQFPEHLKLQKLIEFFRNILIQNEQQSKKRPKYGACKNYEQDLKNNLNKKGTLDKLKSKFKL